MERITHREYLARLAWIREQWNRPSRTDYYLMQVSQEVRRTRTSTLKDFKAIVIDMFRMVFKWETKDEKPKPTMTVEQRTALAKAAWFGRVGIKKRPPS